MNKSKKIRVPIAQCNKKTKHKAHLQGYMFGADHHSIQWCPGKKK